MKLTWKKWTTLLFCSFTDVINIRRLTNIVLLSFGLINFQIEVRVKVLG